MLAFDDACSIVLPEEIEMSGSFQLVWEALHPDADQFGGVLVDSPAGHGFLFYPGDVRRTGVLMWQKNKVHSAAEVQCIRYRVDEIVWSRSLGADLDVSRSYSHELRQILQIRPLMLVQSAVVLAICIGAEQWRVVALSKEDGALLWSTDCVEPAVEAGIESADLFVAVRSDGTVDLLRMSSGKVISSLLRVADGASIQTGSAGVAIVDDTGILHFFAPDGKKRFQLQLTLGELDSAENRVRVRVDDVLLCDAGRLRSLSAQDGQVRWTVPTVGLGQVALFETRSYVIVQALSPPGVMVHRADTGAVIESPVFGQMRHWVEDNGDIVGPDRSGNVVVVDGAVGLVKQTLTAEELTVFEVAVSDDGRMFATAVRTQDDPLILLEFDLVTGGVLRQTELPAPGTFHLDAPTSRSVIVSSGVGVAVYDAGPDDRAQK